MALSELTGLFMRFTGGLLTLFLSSYRGIPLSIHLVIMSGQQLNAFH